jgi:hypothetical protein
MSLKLKLIPTNKHPKMGDLVDINGKLVVADGAFMNKYDHLEDHKREQCKVVDPYGIEDDFSDYRNLPNPDDWVVGYYGLAKYRVDEGMTFNGKVVMQPSNFYKPNLVELNLKDGDSIAHLYCEDEGPEIDSAGFDSTGFNHMYPKLNHNKPMTVTLTVEELHELTLEAFNKGMNLRQSQLNGSDGRSGREVHQEWFDGELKFLDVN